MADTEHTAAATALVAVASATAMFWWSSGQDEERSKREKAEKGANRTRAAKVRKARAAKAASAAGSQPQPEPEPELGVLVSPRALELRRTAEKSVSGAEEEAIALKELHSELEQLKDLLDAEQKLSMPEGVPPSRRETADPQPEPEPEPEPELEPLRKKGGRPLALVPKTPPQDGKAEAARSPERYERYERLASEALATAQKSKGKGGRPAQPAVAGSIAVAAAEAEVVRIGADKAADASRQWQSRRESLLSRRRAGLVLTTRAWAKKPKHLTPSLRWERRLRCVPSVCLTVTSPTLTTMTLWRRGVRRISSQCQSRSQSR